MGEVPDPASSKHAFVAMVVDFFLLLPFLFPFPASLPSSRLWTLEILSPTQFIWSVARDMVFGSTSVSVKERLGGDLRMTNTLDVGMRGRLRKQANAAPHPPLCEQSPAATADIIILIMVLSACGVLVTPYLKFICSEILPATFAMIWEMVKRAPLAYGSGAVLILAAAIGAVEIYHCRSRRCHNPRCKGLKKPMEFDIQLKTEECLKSQDDEEQVPWKGGLQLRPQHKELENELRRLAPPNGKAILLFRASCGCPVAKLEAWGPKRSRRLKR